MFFASALGFRYIVRIVLLDNPPLTLALGGLPLGFGLLVMCSVAAFVGFDFSFGAGPIVG